MKNKPSPEKGKFYSGMSDDQLDEYRLRNVSGTDASDFLTDYQALKECKQKISELKKDIREAEKNNDIGRIAQFKNDLRQLENYVRRSTDHRGKPKKHSLTLERIRKSVSNAISRALQEIQKEHEVLWRHLHDSIQLGYDPIYNPDTSIPWQF